MYEKNISANLLHEIIFVWLQKFRWNRVYSRQILTRLKCHLASTFHCLWTEFNLKYKKSSWILPMILKTSFLSFYWNVCYLIFYLHMINIHRSNKNTVTKKTNLTLEYDLLQFWIIMWYFVLFFSSIFVFVRTVPIQQSDSTTTFSTDK